MIHVRALLAGLALASLMPAMAPAHPTQFTTLQVRIEASGRFEANLNIDILSFALGSTSAASTNEELEAALDSPRPQLGQMLADAGERFRREVVIHTDAGDAAPDAWQLPGLAEVDAVLARGLHPRILMPGDIAFSGKLPANAHRISIRLPYVLGDTIQLYELPNGRSYDEPVAAGEYSTATTVELAPPQSAAEAPALGRYIVVGFRRVLPGGLEHVLFVLGLFLLSTRLRAQVWQIAAFTVAYSITLWLSVYGIIRVPPSITGPLIAASIVCVGVDNLFTSKVQPWRLPAVFVFGLAHGLGFASALAGLGLPSGRSPSKVLGFNLGVECAQFSVIAGAFLLVGWFRERPWYRLAVVLPASVLIAAVGMFWTVQRIIWAR